MHWIPFDRGTDRLERDILQDFCDVLADSTRNLNVRTTHRWHNLTVDWCSRHRVPNMLIPMCVITCCFCRHDHCAPSAPACHVYPTTFWPVRSVTLLLSLPSAARPGSSHSLHLFTMLQCGCAVGLHAACLLRALWLRDERD